LPASLGLIARELLVIEGDATPREASVCAALSGEGAWRCARVDWPAGVAAAARPSSVDLVVAVAVPETEGVAGLLEAVRCRPTLPPTFVVLPRDPPDPVLRAVTASADDFIFSPLRADELRHRLARLLGGGHDSASVQRRLTAELGLSQFVGGAPALVRVIEQIPAVARSEAPVLITGETGTGKELCARAIHHLSRRAGGPFIAVDCGAVPDHLFESEVFGHVRGAFTDAHRDQRGLVALAEGGTLFLDEVDALPLTAQAKLLRFLQERTYRPLGADRFTHADVNVIAASNRDLEACVRRQQFRADLFYRLNVIRLHLPPLRERREDVPSLATHFLRTQRPLGRPGPRSFTPAALRKLVLYDWPGNARELCNVVQRAAVLAHGPHIVPAELAIPDPSAAGEVSSFRAARAEAVAAFERRFVIELLGKHGGNVTRAAREAQQERRAFGRLIKKHGIDRLR
jgi:DNA-binding NtrC family response regulator